MKTLNPSSVIGHLVLAGTLALAFGSVARATTISIDATYNLNTVYTGSIPDGTAPWLSASFNASQGSESGILTLTSNLTGSDFVQGLSSNKSALGWGFYLNSNIASVTCISGNCANTVLSGGAYNSGPVPGIYNLAFGWNAQNRFTGADYAEYSLTFENALGTNPFSLNTAGWVSVAHIQGIGDSGSCSGWIVSGNGEPQGGAQCGSTPPPNVPEPGVLGLFAFGLLLTSIAVIRRRPPV